MGLRIIESTSLSPTNAYQQCIHGKAMNQRCDDCATHQLPALRAANLIKRLLDWAEYTGGWDAPVWEEAKQFRIESDNSTECDGDRKGTPDTESGNESTLHACKTLRALDIALGVDFHALKREQVEGLLVEASRMRYREPRNAKGSRARYFHDMLQRLARAK